MPTQAELEPDVLHCQAIKALLDPAGFPVYLGEADIPDQPPFPYIVAWAAPGEQIPGDTRMAGYSGSLTTRHQLTIAALTPLDVLGVAGRARRLLHRRRPQIVGRRCGDITQEAGPGAVPAVDPTVRGPQGQPIYVAFQFYTLTST